MQGEMILMFTVDDAIKIAYGHHEGQVDKNGSPYKCHLQRVAGQFEIVDYKIVGYLHDILEDTECKIDDLTNYGVPWQIVEWVNILTHKKNELYEHYIYRVSQNCITREVKLADIYDNLDPQRLNRLDSKTKNRLLRKYGKALEILGSCYSLCE
jgi:(p)ppGpp synthase/HD superfamily hydrolase